MKPFGSSGILVMFIASLVCFYSNCSSTFSAYAQDQQPKDVVIVTIPKGSANPEVDITNLSPRQWYDPREISIGINDTVRWTNNDTEPHTVTSGLGGGIASLLTNSQGKPNGLFDTGLFAPDTYVSIKFNESGTFNYFCTIHPWMEGIIHVRDTSTNIPSYAVDEFGNKIDDFPIYNFTGDENVEIGLSWTPLSIITGKPINFIMDFFEFPENSRLHLWPFNFVILQNNTEIFRTTGISQVGSAAQTYYFNSPGKTIIKIEDASNKSSFVQFGTIVYENPYGTSLNEVQNVSNRSLSLLSPLTLVYVVYAIIIALPLGLVTLIILYKKKKI
jgi:plastocyanin